MAVERHLGEYLVAHHDGAGRLRQLPDAAQVVGRPHAADGVVGVADHEHLVGRIRHEALEVVEVHFVAAVVGVAQAVVDRPAAQTPRSLLVAVVHRRLHDDGVAGIGGHADGRRHRKDGALCGDDPRRIDLPRAGMLHPPADALEVAVLGQREAVEAALGIAPGGIDDARGRLEVHLGPAEAREARLEHAFGSHAALQAPDAPAVDGNRLERARFHVRPFYLWCRRCVPGGACPTSHARHLGRARQGASPCSFLLIV